MKEFTRDQRASAFDKLPKELKSFIVGDESSSIFQDIGKLHQLNIEKTGVLADIITLTLLGLISRDHFVLEVRDRLEIDESLATKIAETSNEYVFQKVRVLLQKNPSNLSLEAEIPAPQEDEHPMKADLLAEIENPTPVAHPISSVPPAPQTSVNTSLPTVEPTHLPTMQPQVKPVSIPAAPVMPKASITQSAQQQPAKQSVTNDFIAGKMTETVNMPPQKYSTDPYREPLN